MKFRLATLLVVGVVASSCGGDRLSAEDYFAEASAASADYDQATDLILDVYRGADAAATDVAAAFERSASPLEALISVFEALEPPAAAQSAHDNEVAALQASLDAIPELVTALRGAGTFGDVSSMLSSSEFGTERPRVAAACLELEAVASALGVSADLHCRLSAADYFAEASAASTRYDLTTDEIFDVYAAVVEDALLDFDVRTAGSDTETLAEEAALLLNTTVTKLSSAFEQAATALETFVAVLGDFEPPASVQSAHNEATTALQISLDAIPDLVTELRGAVSLGDISFTITESAFGDAQPRVIAACLELEGLASDLGVAADLRCGELDDSGESE